MEEAIRSGDLEQVRELIRSGANVNARQGYSEGSLLHLAIQEGYKDIALALLEVGADIHAKDITGRTALHYAWRSEEVVQALIDRGSRVNERDKFGYTPLMVAVGRDKISLCLLRAGASCEGLEQSRVDDLLYSAWEKRDLSAIKTLFSNGYSGRILSTKEQEVLLHQANSKDVHTIVAYNLLKNSYTVMSQLSIEEQEELLHFACCKGDAFVACNLLKNGCSAGILSREEQEELLHHACRDVFVVHTLLKNDCSVSILSREKQEELLHLACRESDVFVVRTLLKNNWRVSILSREEQEKLLHLACNESDVFIVEALLASGCDMNCADSTGFTPLMAATEKDHEEVVKKLILAGANLGTQTVSGDTALHIAASHNRIQCGILLAEGGASVRTKNKLSKTSLALASVGFRKAIKEALSFTTRKALCIIGNAESGKSTLIAALQAESNSFFGKIVNQFRRVDDHRQRTAGIETVPHCSQRYGEVLFFDFAGQDDYHGPHQMFLESLLSKPGVSMTLLLLVKMTEEEDAILHQLHRWLTPVALMATPASPHVIVIGSFLDKVKSQKVAIAKLTRCIEATRRELSLEFVGSSFLDCRQPQCKGIDQICAFLQDIPVPEFRATHTRYSLAWVLYQIRSSITAKAVQLSMFSNWVQINKYNLPQTMPPPEEVCQDLSAAGHALYLPKREDPPKSWLVLDLPSILHDVYGTLFSQYRERVNRFGLVQRRHLAELFPHLDLEMVQQLLISLEFCLPVDPSVLKVDLSELTQSRQTSGWLFFPALISAKHPQSTLKGPTQQSVCHLCWQLRTAKKYSISARLLQTILLRLAAHFVVKHHNEEGVQQHCCSIWWNGISWKSTKGIDITVHIVNNRVVEVLSASVTSADKSCQYLTNVISDILSTVHRLSPKLAAGAYIVHPPRIATSRADITDPPPQDMFPVEGIRKSFRDGYCLSLKDSNSDCFNRAAIFDLFGGCTPSLEDIGKINWPQPDSGQPQSLCGPSQPQSPCGPNQSLTGPNQSPTGPNQSLIGPKQSPTGPNQSPAGPNQSPAGPNQSPTGPNQSLTGPKQSPTGPNQSPAGPNQSPAGPNQSPTGPNQSLTGPKQSPTGPNQSPAGPNQSPTGPDQSPTGPNQSPTEPNQSPAGPNQSPTEPDQPELHSEVNSVLTPTDSSTPPSGACAHLDVLSTPDLRDVDELVVTPVAANWQRVALRLGVEGFVSDVVFRNNPNDCEGACRDMLNRWLRGERHTGEEERTWSSLLTALGRAGFEELERRLRREHFHSP